MNIDVNMTLISSSKTFSLKKKFIEKNSNDQFIISTLAKFSKYEKKFNKDISEFNRDNIKEVIMSFDSVSPKSIRNKLYVAQKYTEYYLSNTGSDNENIYKTYTLKEIESVIADSREERYITEKRIYSFLEKLNSNRDKFLILAIYEGLGSRDIKDIGLLKPEDFTFGEVTVDGKIYQIPILLTKYALEASKEKLLADTNADYDVEYNTDYGLILNPRVDVVSEDSLNPQRVRQRLRRRFAVIRSEINVENLTILDLERSGMIEHFVQAMREQRVKDIEDLKEETLKRILSKYNKETSNMTDIKRMFNDLGVDLKRLLT